MTFILGMLIVLVALYFIAAPFLSENEPMPAAAIPKDEDGFEKQKESVFTTLNELEFDFRMKKISEDDYRVLKNKYKSQAISVLKSEEDLDTLIGRKQIRIDAEMAKKLENEIETQVAELRNQH